MRAWLILLTILCAPQVIYAQNPSTFNRVQSSHEIRCGYAAWNPVVFKDTKTGEIKGIIPEILNALGKKLDYKITWAEEAGWGSVVEGLKIGRYDMICTGIGAYAPRAKVMDFTVPLFYINVYAVSRADDRRFDKGLTAINDPNVKISVLEGQHTSMLAMERFPKAKTDALPQLTDYSMVLEEVKTGKADVTFVEGSSLANYLKNNPGTLKITGGKETLGRFRVPLGLPQGDYQFKRMIDTVLEELMDEGAVENILQKYDPRGDIFPRVR
jgi:ABC-type amino acid transport substrate-binding protein